MKNLESVLFLSIASVLITFLVTVSSCDVRRYEVNACVKNPKIGFCKK